MKKINIRNQHIVPIKYNNIYYRITQPIIAFLKMPELSVYNITFTESKLSVKIDNTVIKEYSAFNYYGTNTDLLDVQEEAKRLQNLEFNYSIFKFEIERLTYSELCIKTEDDIEKDKLGIFKLKQFTSLEDLYIMENNKYKRIKPELVDKKITEYIK